MSPASYACEAENWTINGTSLEPLLQHGEEIRGTVLPCNVPIDRDDLLIFRHAGNTNPVIKIVKGLPADAFAFADDGSNVLRVNDRIVTNSAGEPYVFAERRRAMLELYRRDYSGMIPPDTYLVLGDNMNGTIDSSTFGLVHERDVIAVVKRETLK